MAKGSHSMLSDVLLSTDRLRCARLLNRVTTWRVSIRSGSNPWSGMHEATASTHGCRCTGRSAGRSRRCGERVDGVDRERHLTDEPQPGRSEPAADDVDRAGVPQPLRIPSEEIKILGGLSVEEGGTTTVTLDFDAEASLNRLGNGQWLMTPIIVMADP